MNVTIPRKSDDGIETLGNLIVTDDNNQELYNRYTLERPWLNNQRAVSCIPPDTYPCMWGYQEDLKEWHYEIQNVPGRSGIFIHEFNQVKQSEGCIGTGTTTGHLNGDTETDILSSRAALNEFERIMNKQPFNITITAPPKA